MSEVDVPEPENPELEKPLHDVEDEFDTDEDHALDAVGQFRASVTASADLSEHAANVQVTDALVRSVVADAKKGATNPFEAVSRNEPAPRLDALVARRDAILAGATDAEVGTAHAMFLEAVFGQDMSTVNERGAASDRLLTEMIHRVRGEAMPPSGDPKADAYVENLVSVWTTTDDTTFWKSMATAWDGSPITAEDAKSHLLFLRAVGDLTPPNLASESFLWRTPSAKLAVIEKITAAGGAAPDPNANPPGGIDIAAMYRQAASSTSLGKPVPRAVATELVRLALAELTGGVRRVAKVKVRSPREVVTRALAAETIPPKNDPKRDATIDRNTVRGKALELLSTTNRSMDKSAKTDTAIDLERALSQASVEENFREGRYDVGQVFDHLSDYLNLALNRRGGNTEAKRIAKLVSGSGLSDSLAKWSALYRAGTSDLTALSLALRDINDGAKLVVAGLGTPTDLDPVSQLSYALRIAIDAAGTEVARQAAELVTASNGGAKPEPGTPLGGACDAADTASSRGRARRAAVIARERPGGLGDFAAKMLKAYSDVSWAKAINSAATAWTTADGTDVATMLQSSTTLATALDAARKTLATASGGDRFIGSSVVDAIAFAVMDRITTLAATGGDVTTATRDALIAALATSTPPFADPPDLTTYWSNGKDTIAGKLPAGLTLDLTGRITAWAKSAAARPVNPSVLATQAFSVVQAVTDYRARIEAGTNTADDKAILLGLLDTVLFSMQTRMQALDTA